MSHSYLFDHDVHSFGISTYLFILYVFEYVSPAPRPPSGPGPKAQAQAHLDQPAGFELYLHGLQTQPPQRLGAGEQ